MKITNEQLIKLHELELDMLTEVRRVCELNNIKYFIIGGTMLGAVRHKGFIPWDDDADVGMLREDYEKFRKVCETDLNHEKYYFQDDRNTKGYRWGYGKIRRKNTLFLRENQRHLDFGQEVFIDIFPLDNVPNGKIAQLIHFQHCFIIRKMLWSVVGVKVEKNIIKKGIYWLFTKIPKERIYEHYYKYIGSVKESNFVKINLFQLKETPPFRRCLFMETDQYEFEGELFSGVKDYDEYLTWKFHDYMTLPPVEKRKIHPVEEIRL